MAASLERLHKPRLLSHQAGEEKHDRVSVCDGGGVGRGGGQSWKHWAGAEGILSRTGRIFQDQVPVGAPRQLPAAATKIDAANQLTKQKLSPLSNVDTA